MLPALPPPRNPPPCYHDCMVTEAPDATAIDEFARNVGEWLLTQRFGEITPLAFRYHVWEPRDPCEGELPHVAIDLLVNDPPPPPPEWHRLNARLDLSLDELSEWTQGLLWPRADRYALRDAAHTHARALGVPPGITPGLPVEVRLCSRSEGERCGFGPLDD